MKKLITIKNGTIKIEKVKKTDYKTLKTLLENVDTLTCVARIIGNKYYDIWLDDEGLLKDDKLICSALADEGIEALVGNLVIARSDLNGNTIGLENEDIEIIKNNFIELCTGGILSYNTTCGNKLLLLRENGGFLRYKIYE